jgi:hypothetical protein
MGPFQMDADPTGTRSDLAAIYAKIGKIEQSTNKIQSINLAAIIAVVLLALILWRVW